MITDSETNLVYFSSLLTTEDRYKPFWKRLKAVLVKESIPFRLIEGTKDIWCRDYMPIQVACNNFQQFQYFPDYLNNKKWSHKRTIQEEVRSDFNQKTQLSSLIIDGGNVVKHKNAVILTEKVFKENPELRKDEVFRLLSQMLQVDQLFFLPRQPYDMTGHSDGMVRFLNSETLLVSDYQGESSSWKNRYERALKNTGLNLVVLPSVTLNEKNELGDYAGRGCYINFAQVGNKILFPFFGLSEDRLALQEIKKLYSDCKIISVEANEIAQDGGVLNCITWNIKK